MRYLHYILTEVDKEWCRLKAEEDGKYKGSIKGTTLYGNVGELAFSKFFPDFQWVNNSDYDFIAPNGTTIDVKTDAGNFKPKPAYGALVEDRGAMGPQACNIYCFAHCLYDLSEVWLVGWDFQQIFYKTARFMRKGQEHPSMATGKVLEDCFRKEYGELQDMDAFKQGVNKPLEML